MSLECEELKTTKRADNFKETKSAALKRNSDKGGNSTLVDKELESSSDVESVKYRFGWPFSKTLRRKIINECVTKYFLTFL